MANTYGKVSGTFQEIDNAYGKVSGVWQEADEIYAKVSGTWELVFAAFTPGSIQTLSSGSGTFTVPDGANAIHIQASVGGGGGAARDGRARAGRATRPGGAAADQVGVCEAGVQLRRRRRRGARVGGPWYARAPQAVLHIRRRVEPARRRRSGR